MSKRFFTTASVPFQILERTAVFSESEKLEGLGDITVMGWYTLPIYKKLRGTDIPFENKIPTGHTMNVGLGVKLPTGRFEERLADRVIQDFKSVLAVQTLYLRVCMFTVKET